MRFECHLQENDATDVTAENEVIQEIMENGGCDGYCQEC